MATSNQAWLSSRRGQWKLCLYVCFLLLELATHTDGSGTADGPHPSRGLIVDDEDAVQVKCPEPEVPQRYSVDQEVWTFLDTFTFHSGSKKVGSLVRTMFSTSGEVRLFDGEGALWAAVQRSGDGLLVTDCAGRGIASLAVTQAAGLLGLGSPPKFDIATANGEVVGKTSNEGASSKGAQVAIEDTGGNVFSRIQQQRPLAFTQTQLLVIDPDAAVSGSNAIDQRTDPRVLSLLAASRLGSPIGLVLFAGPVVTGLLLVALLGGCAYIVVRQCCRRRRGPSSAWTGGLLGDDSDVSDEERRRGGLFACCTRPPFRHLAGGKAPFKAPESPPAWRPF